MSIYKGKVECGCVPDSELHSCPCASGYGLSVVGFMSMFSVAINFSVILVWLAYTKPCWFTQVIC